MTIGLLAPLLGYLATLIPKAVDEVAMSPIKHGVKQGEKAIYGDNKQQQGLVAAPPQQAPGLAGQMQPQPIPMPEAIPTNTPGIYGPMGSSHLEPATGLHGEGPGPDPLNSPMRQPPMMRGDPANSLASMVTLNPPQQQQAQGMMQQGHQNTDPGHSHSHPGMSALGDALVLYGQMTSPNGDPKAALQMIQQRRQAQAQAQMQAAEVAREQANRREDIQIQGQQFGQKMAADQQQLKQGADQFAASEEDKRLTREAQAKQAAADNALNTGKLDLERTNAANENQYRQGMLANAQAETKQKQQQAAMSSLFTTQLMSRMGLLPHDTPQQVALMHDTAQANNPGQPGMGTPQPQQAAMEQPQPGQQDYIDQLHEYGLSDAQIMTAAMAKDPAKALNDAINTSRTVSGEKTMNEETAKNEVTRNTKLQDASTTAANQNAILNQQESLINEAFSGRFGNDKAAFFNALSSAGIPVSDEMKQAAGATEAASTMGRQMVMAKLGSLGRNISDADVRMTLGMFADPKNTPIGNKMLFKILRANNQRDIDLQQLAIHLRHENKGHLPDDWEQRVQNYDETHKAALHDEIMSMAPSAGGGSGNWNSTQGGVKYRIVQ